MGESKQTFFEHREDKLYVIYTNFFRDMDYISIDGHMIGDVRQTKFLGVILYNKLNWHAHCDYIRS